MPDSTGLGPIWYNLRVPPKGALVMIVCSQRSHVQIEIEMTEYSDKARLDKFLELLPEEKVDEFTHAVSDARYWGYWNVHLLHPYASYSKSVKSKFLNKKIEQARKELNQAFSDLDSFLSFNFFVYQTGKGLEDQRFGLYPEMRHAKGENGKFWSQKYEELLSLIRAFENKYKVFLEVAMEELSDDKKEVYRVSNRSKPIKDGLLLGPELKPEIEVGDLVAYSDGTIRYKKEIIELRNQLKDLCRLFMRNQNRVLILEDIKNEIIPAPKRKNTSNQTIAKYVSELRSSLKIFFQRDVLPNQKGEGWYLDLKK